MNVNQLNFDGIGMTSRRTQNRLIQRLEEQGIRNKKVLEVMACTPRHWFLDEALAHRAYEDSSLPIGHGQTLSQPYIVAKMTELLFNQGRPPKKVLEIGTGSGYQTSILAQLVSAVWTVERIMPLQVKAKERLKKLGLKNISFKHADGTLGWSGNGQYEAIISTAAPASVPQELLAQLAPEGVLVMPVGDEYRQELILVKHDSKSGKFLRRVVEPAFFVPLLAGITS
jgi:protein-L-isoaspartate(D-aspartate) O-methyltransferase